MSDDPKADADPIADPDRCTATAKSTSERCKQPAVPGANVCRFHGGSAEQVQKKAQERLDEMADSTTAKLQERLDEAEDHDQFVKLLREVRQLTTNILDRTDHGPTETREVTGDGGGAVEVTFNEKVVETPWDPNEETE